MGMTNIALIISAENLSGLSYHSGRTSMVNAFTFFRIIIVSRGDYGIIKVLYQW